NEEEALRAVEDHPVRIALHLDARGDLQRGEVDHDNLAIANARYVRGAIALHGDPEGELPAGDPGLSGVDLARTQVELRRLHSRRHVDDADRVVLEVGDDDLRSVCGERQAGGLAVDGVAEAGNAREEPVPCATRVAERNGRAAFGPPGGAERVHV